MANCKFCGAEGYWKDENTKWVLYNQNNTKHSCVSNNQIKKNELTLQSFIKCKTCGIKISIAGLKKRVERLKAESEAISGQSFNFEGLDKPEEIARSCCINPECKGVGYVIV